MTWVLWDLIAVLIISSMVYRCARSGFLRTVVNFLGYVVSAMLAGALSPKLAQGTYDLVVRDAMRAVITRRVEEAVSNGEIAGLMNTLPGWMRLLMNSSAGQSYMGELDAAGAVEALIDMALADPIITLLNGIFFFLLFWLLSMFARRVSQVFSGVNRLPILGTFNTFLGGVVGVLQALLTLYLVSVAVRLVIVLSGGEIALLSEAVIEEGYIFRFFYHMSG